MKTTTLHIEKPSKGLLDLVRRIQSEKDAQEQLMKSNWNKYFPKK
jgi:hypothetical protein